MKKYVPLIIVSFIYYAVLSARTWTWVFVSSDSGDWLAAANQWMVVQPYGSPLYISLMRLIGSLTDGNATVAVATILLSSLPSAITVTLIYLIVRTLTNKAWCAIASSLVLLGAGVFLTQSTILEEYALAIMFLTLAYWLYLNDKRKLTALSLGLGTAVHIFILPISVFWLALEHKRFWLKPASIYVVSGILPYSLVLVLMHLDTPRLLAGSLSLANVMTYLFDMGGTVFGTLSVFEAPYRILAITKILLPSLGLALIPLYYGLKRPYDTKKLVLLMIVVVALWYHLTSLDPMSWTFLNFGLPSLAILTGIGLSKLTLKHTHIITASALALIAINAAFLNANILTNQNPLATAYYNELMSLPDGAVVVANAGGHSLGLFYVMSEGKNLIPIIYPHADEAWFSNGRIEGNSTLNLVQNAIDKGMDVYYAGSPRDESVAQAFVLADTNNKTMQRVLGLTGLQPTATKLLQSHTRWEEVLDGWTK